MMLVIKKDNTLEPFEEKKIATAALKAASRVDHKLTVEDLDNIVNTVKARIEGIDKVPVVLLHEMVIASLSANGFQDVSASYAEYRYYKTQYAKTFEKLHQDADDVLHLGDRENANFDSSLVSTKGALIKGYLTKSLYKQFYLSKSEKFLTERGDIYVHDLRDLILGAANCCLFDIGAVLDGGFEMSNVQYTEPKSVLSALQVIGDITLVATAQQFGGFTLAELDKVLLKYVKKSYNAAYYRYYNEMGMDKTKADSYAKHDTIRELEQGFQSLELKLNTVPCSRGDFAFTTVTFGQWNYKEISETDSFWLKTIDEVILKTRREGHGKNHRPVVFPKLVFLYDKEQIDNDKNSQELFDEAVKTSAQCMYPDYLSLSSEYGSVSKLFKETGAITSPMGCRAYLSPWADEKTGKYITIGRCNIGAVSLNIPLILRIVQHEHPTDWKEQFWPELDKRLEVIREFLKKRYDIIRHQKCSSNPLAFTQGGFYQGYKNPDDEVGDLVRYMTASFGITALDQASYLWCGKRMAEDQSFGVAVLEHLKEKIAEYKHEDGYLYAIYGTPAESLCATQAKQYDEWCRKIGVENVFRRVEHYNPEYFTNSFHCNVTEDITPFEKQDYETKCFHLAEGGHIQYVRVDNPENLDALKAVIKRGMEKGFYQGVNFDAAYCNDCGEHSTNVLNKCPCCGSPNITVVSRVCGYLAYTNVNGKTRMNDGKLAEINDRKSM